MAHFLQSTHFKKTTLKQETVKQQWEGGSFEVGRGAGFFKEPHEQNGSATWI